MAAIEALPRRCGSATRGSRDVTYLRQTFWPAGLVGLLPFPVPPADWREVVPAGALLAVLTAGAVATARRWPWVCFGWLWFVITLLPVIGLVQVGDQAHGRPLHLPALGGVAGRAGMERGRAVRGRRAARGPPPAWRVTSAACAWPAASADPPPGGHPDAVRAHARASIPTTTSATSTSPPGWPPRAAIGRRSPTTAAPSHCGRSIAIAHSNLGAVLRRSGDSPGPSASCGAPSSSSPTRRRALQPGDALRRRRGGWAPPPGTWRRRSRWTLAIGPPGMGMAALLSATRTAAARRSPSSPRWRRRSPTPRSSSDSSRPSGRARSTSRGDERGRRLGADHGGGGPVRLTAGGWPRRASSLRVPSWPSCPRSPAASCSSTTRRRCRTTPRSCAGSPGTVGGWPSPRTTSATGCRSPCCRRCSTGSSWGARACGHHLTSVLLHCLATVLVFLSVARLAGAGGAAARGRAMAVAALFAIHPLAGRAGALVDRPQGFALGRPRAAVAAALRALARGADAAVVGSASRWRSPPRCSPRRPRWWRPSLMLVLDFWPLRRLSLAGERADGGSPAVRSGGPLAAAVREAALAGDGRRPPVSAPLLSARAGGAMAALDAAAALHALRHRAGGLRHLSPADLLARRADCLLPVAGRRWSRGEVLVAATIFLVITAAALALRAQHAVARRRVGLVGGLSAAGLGPAPGRRPGDRRPLHLPRRDRDGWRPWCGRSTIWHRGRRVAGRWRWRRSPSRWWRAPWPHGPRSPPGEAAKRCSSAWWRPPATTTSATSTSPPCSPVRASSRRRSATTARRSAAAGRRHRLDGPGCGVAAAG